MAGTTSRTAGDAGDVRTGAGPQAAAEGADTGGEAPGTVEGAAARAPLAPQGYPLRVYYPTDSKPYFQIVWTEDGRRRSTSGGKTLETAQEKVAVICDRLDAQAYKAERAVSELADAWREDGRTRRRPWSPKYQDQVDAILDVKVIPAIGDVVCSRLTTSDLQRAVDSASTSKESVRYRRIVRAMVRWGYGDGYFVTAPERLLKNVQAGEATPTQQGPAQKAVPRSKIPTAEAIVELAGAMRQVEAGLRGSPAGAHHGELMVYLAAYSGLRFGELLALRVKHIDVASRRIEVRRQFVEVKGIGITETEPKGKKFRETIYPATAPGGYPLAGELRRRVEAAAEAGGDEALLFTTARGDRWSQSRFGARRFRPAAERAGWERDPETDRLIHTWHSLRHRFAAWLLWELDPPAAAADVAEAMGHNSVSVTLQKYASAPAAALDRLAAATD